MLVIDANYTGLRYWKDIWEFRELALFLTWRNFLVRYKQTAVGIAWTLFRPLIAVFVLTLIFGRVANLAARETVPYPLLVLTGILPWQLFSNTLAECSESVISNANLISKIYFPRIIVPLSSSLVVVVDFLVTLLLAFAVLAWYQYPITWQMTLLPLAIFLCWALSFGIGLFVAAFNVKWRDFRYLIPFVLQFGLYLTPVGFSSHLIEGPFKWMFALNPLVGIIELFRFCFLGQGLDVFALTISCIFSFSIFFLGIFYFRKVERHFADII